MPLTKVSYSMIKGATHNILDYGAVGDGTTDDTAAIQAALDAAGAAGGGEVYVPAGSYVVSTLTMKYNNVRLFGGGNSSRLYSNADPTTLHDPTIWIARDNCTVDGLYLSYLSWVDAGYASLGGPRPEGNSHYGSPISVNYTELYTSAGSGVYNTLWGVTLQVVHNPTIMNCTVHGAAIHAVSMFNCFGAVVKNNVFEQFKGTGVLGFITPNTLVEGNRFVSSGDDATFFADLSVNLNGVWTPITTAECRDIRILGNYAEKIAAKLWCACGYTDVVIANNTAANQRGDAIITRSEPGVPASASNNVVIANNVFINCFGGFGPLVDGYRVQTDIISAGAGEVYVFNCSDSSNVTLIGNSASWDTRVSGGFKPFSFASSDSVSITGNSFLGMASGGADIGAVLDGSNVATNYVISGNQFIKKSGIGGRCLNMLRGLSSVAVTNNIFYCDAAYSATANEVFINVYDSSKILLTNNIFNNPNSFNVLRTVEGITNSYAKENICIGDFGNRPNTLAVNKVVGYGSAAPTTGSYTVGDIIYNTSATAGGYVGWVCVASGTPGTWKTFGVISV